MIRVMFQNGPEAPEIVLDHKFETKEEAKSQLDWFVDNYGTVDGAVAWIEGDDKPKAAAKAHEEYLEAEAEREAELAGSPIADTLESPELDEPVRRKK